MDMLDNDQKRLNLRYQGQYGWGRLEARAYHETVEHFMDFGADKRYWYGGSVTNDVIIGSGGPTVLNGTPCSPLGSTCAAGMPMNTESRNTGSALNGDVDLSATDLLRVGAEIQRYRLNDWSTSSTPCRLLVLTACASVPGWCSGREPVQARTERRRGAWERSKDCSGRQRHRAQSGLSRLSGVWNFNTIHGPFEIGASGRIFACGS